MAPKLTSRFIKIQLDMPTMKLSKTFFTWVQFEIRQKLICYMFTHDMVLLFSLHVTYDIFLNIRQQKYEIHGISCVEIFFKKKKKLESNMEQKRKIQHIIDNVSKEFIYARNRRRKLNSLQWWNYDAMLRIARIVSGRKRIINIHKEWCIIGKLI